MTHHRLQIRARPDRQLLCSLFEQGKQILQVIVKMFGSEDDNESMTAAAAFLQSIAEEYESDKLQKPDLKKRKDELLLEKFGTAKPAARKRPAAATEVAVDDANAKKRPAATAKPARVEPDEDEGRSDDEDGHNKDDQADQGEEEADEHNEAEEEEAASGPEQKPPKRKSKDIKKTKKEAKTAGKSKAGSVPMKKPAATPAPAAAAAAAKTSGMATTVAFKMPCPPAESMYEMAIRMQ